MVPGSLRILVVEDDYLVASKLQREITDAGDVVVGPFANVDDAIGRVELVQAAILDVKVRDETPFALADSLFRNEVPFVFLTGHDKGVIPERFLRQHIYAKPSHADPILHDLHSQHRAIERLGEDSMETIVLEMIHRSCTMMPDRASADRLVEAVLLRAIADTRNGKFRDRIRLRLLDMLEDEYLRRGRTFLN